MQKGLPTPELTHGPKESTAPSGVRVASTGKHEQQPPKGDTPLGNRPAAQRAGRGADQTLSRAHAHRRLPSPAGL